MPIDAFKPIRITQVFASRKSIQQCRSFRHAWGRDIERSDASCTSSLARKERSLGGLSADPLGGQAKGVTR
jgi:hypothetical protein